MELLRMHHYLKQLIKFERCRGRALLRIGS
jgi:hypothetical protein